MRAMFLVVASVLLCVGLFGCNRAPEAPGAAPVVAVAPPCNCAPPVAPAPVTQAVRHPRHHHHAWSEHESASYESYGESGNTSSGQTHDYSESSDQSAGQPDAPHARAAAWVDGYGRSHYATDETADENPARLSAEDRHNRRAVWRGFDSKCAERGE